MANNVEKQALNFFIMGTREFLNAFNVRDLNPGRLISAIFFYFVAFLFVGSETIKILFRKHFNQGNLDFPSIIIATVSFWIWSLMCFSKMNETSDSTQYLELLGAVLLNTILGVIILAKGLYDWNKPDSTGEPGTKMGKTIFFGFFRDTFMTEYRIMMFLEPYIILGIAAYLNSINYYLGTPLIFCAVSRLIVNIINAKRVIEESNSNVNNSNDTQGRRNIVE